MNNRKAVILLSGGLDSTTTLAIAIDQGYTPYALSVEYGQRHAHEIEAARAIAKQMNVQEHLVLQVDLARIGGSALTDEIAVPKSSSVEEIGDEIPVTYVPARNTVFLSLALAWSEALQAGDLFIGVNALDYSGYPDCRPEYIAAFQNMANLATKAAVQGELPIRLHTPLINLTKQQIIAQGLQLGVDYSGTISCYDPSPEGVSCGQCDACLLRKRGFAENGVEDPIPYR